MHNINTNIFVPERSHKMRICGVLNCGNSTYHLNKWRERHCTVHECNYGTARCTCDPLFELFPFPTEQKDPKTLQQWIKSVNRKDEVTGKNWQPKADSRICSVHFIDSKPTVKHPVPTLNLGYLLRKETKGRSLPKRHELPTQKAKTRQTDPHPDATDMTTATEQEEERVSPVTIVHDDHSYIYQCNCQDKCACYGCMGKQLTINKLKQRICELESQLEAMDTEKPQSQKKTVNFNLKNVLKQTNKHSSKKWTKKETDYKDELVIVLLKLRLALGNDLLADLFGISSSMCSCIINTWLKLLSSELECMVYWPSKEEVRNSLPTSFQLQMPKVRCILDCTEVFIQRPRNLELQALTWSDYKKHNTIKCLVGIAPNGLVTFYPRHGAVEPPMYPTDEIMADRGFPIQEALLMRQAKLVIPPGARGSEQMTIENVRKTKQVANLRIHVERAINRIKWFKILSGTLPIKIVPLADDIVTVCAALSNLHRPPVT
uniref:THAP-type domain-containing protein n=1 Tax=Neogobius melanostomus TaxID=47308 RepID=A0A8C6WRK7_9GOBI